MSESMEIQCIKKSGLNEPYELILAIGGIDPTGKPWNMSEGFAIDGIKNGRYRFYINLGGKPVDVTIAKSQHGHEYLKTHADGEEPTALLGLPDCP
jgi:hypothetical protein